MNKLMIPTGAALVAALAIAGCGEGGGGDGAAARSGTATVTAKQIAGAGNVLVDAHGAALYTPDQEKSGRIRCVGGCTSIWQPLTLASGTPTGAGDLGTIRRPDGTRQVTAGGRPLYSFVQDHAGNVTGDGAADRFGARRFTWHVVTAKGAPASGSSSSSGGSGGSSGGSGGSGGYGAY